MSVYVKLNQARMQLAGMKLEKSGHNKFAGYNYFELGDFLIPTQTIFSNIGLCGIVSFTADVATLTIVDTEDGSQVVLTSPMGSANLKGCHEVQNIGAVETYQRRYLWVSAMEIVEHDALDATVGKDKPKMMHSATDGVDIDPKRESWVRDTANLAIELFAEQKEVAAYEAVAEITDSEERTYLWGLLKPHSALRSAIKRLADADRAK